VAYPSIIGIAQSFLLTFFEHGRAAPPSVSRVHVIRWRQRPGRGNRIDVGQHRAGGSDGRQSRADREGRGPGTGGGRGKEPREYVRSGTGATGHPALEAPIRGSGSGKVPLMPVIDMYAAAGTLTDHRAGRQPARITTEEGDKQVSAEPASPITTYFRVCDGVRVRYADTKAESDTTVLMLAPWPESLWAFRRIWDHVTPLGRIVALDMPGFGHSDQQRPELIAPDAAGEFLARLIDEWRLGAPHLVGPDVGTAAALFLAATAPERVTSLTIGGGAMRFPIEAGGALKQVIEAPGLDAIRALDARTNISAATEPAAPGGSEPEVHEDYVSAYDLGRFAESARFVRHYPEQNKVLGDLLPTVTTPTQIVAGAHDDLVPWSNNQYLADLLPNNEIHPLDAGHFAWEEAPQEYGHLVADWISGGYRRVVG
jgi:pimeloyl-ACP methyl ester carboxylesterase